MKRLAIVALYLVPACFIGLTAICHAVPFVHEYSAQVLAHTQLDGEWYTDEWFSFNGKITIDHEGTYTSGSSGGESYFRITYNIIGWELACDDLNLYLSGGAEQLFVTNLRYFWDISTNQSSDLAIHNVAVMENESFTDPGGSVDFGTWGSLSAYGIEDFYEGRSIDLYGDGLGVGFDIGQSGGVIYSISSSSAPAPVPEPATILLMSIGIAGFIGKRKFLKN